MGAAPRLPAGAGFSSARFASELVAYPVRT